MFKTAKNKIESPGFAGFFALSLFIAVATSLASTGATAQPTNRNILFIAVDDLRNWVGYAGDYAGTVHTPNIDALAAQSTRFLNAYAAVPQCVGSRTTVMLGLSPETHGITGPSWGASDPRYQNLHSDPDIQSLPQVMSANGYHSAGAGKVFHSAHSDKWDEQGPITVISSLMAPFNPGPDGTFLIPSVLPEGEIHPDQIVAIWATEFIDNYPNEPDTAPFFLAVGFYQPHIPWQAPQWAYDLYPIEDVVVSIPTPGDLDDEPPEAVAIAALPYMAYSSLNQYEAIEAADKAQAYTQAYLAAISHTDAMVGQVLDALTASPYADTTDVVFWSDHGYSLGEKFHWRKNALWDQEIKSPLLVKSPGNANYPPSDVTRNVSLLDLASTVVDLAGLTPIEQFEGKPLYVDDGVNTVYSYWKTGKATMVDGWKIVDYDLATNTIDDLAAYWIQNHKANGEVLPYDTGETNNVILPLIIAILRQQAQAGN